MPAGELEGIASVLQAQLESLGSEVIAYFEPDGAASRREGPVTELAQAAAPEADSVPRLLTARLSRQAHVRESGPADLAVDLERLYFFDPETSQAITT